MSELGKFPLAHCGPGLTGEVFDCCGGLTGRRGGDPANVHPLICVTAIALAHKERPILLRLRPRKRMGYGRVIGHAYPR